MQLYELPLDLLEYPRRVLLFFTSLGAAEEVVRLLETHGVGVKTIYPIEDLSTQDPEEEPNGEETSQ